MPAKRRSSRDDEDAAIISALQCQLVSCRLLFFRIVQAFLPWFMSALHLIVALRLNSHLSERIFESSRQKIRRRRLIKLINGTMVHLLRYLMQRLPLPITVSLLEAPPTLIDKTYESFFFDPCSGNKYFQFFNKNLTYRYNIIFWYISHVNNAKAIVHRYTPKA